MKRFIQSLMLSAALLSAGAQAAGNLSEQGSQWLSTGSGMFVVGSLSMFAGSGQVIVKAVQDAGESTVVVLQKVGDGSTASIKLSGKAAKELAQFAGSAVVAVGMSTGTMLMASGKALAFIPNEIGASLLHQSKV